MNIALTKNLLTILFLLILSILHIACSSETGEPLSEKRILNTACEIYLPLAQKLSPEDGYPRSIIDGKTWKLVPASDWTSGFFPGILWQLYHFSQDSALFIQAKRWTNDLKDQTTAPTHDVGFMINNSFGKGYRIKSLADFKTTTVEAAYHLATRFNPRIGALRSWDWGEFKFPVIIDNMMNLELLYWAANMNGDSTLTLIANTHAKTTIRDHIRDDGSTFHVVDYNPETGKVFWKGTHQGLADSSTWARGQAWGIYGFTVAFRETNEPLFLDTACRLANWFIQHLPEDGIPYWDFDAPDKAEEPKDASAAAIAASGLWELSMLIDEEALSERYRETSKKMTKTLLSEKYSAKQAGIPALLLHSTGSRPENNEVDVPLIYAEYYFIEALIRQLSKSS